MRIVGRILIWVLAIVGGLTVLTIVFGVIAASHHQAPSLPKRMILSFDVDQGVTEIADGSPLAAFGVHKGYVVKDVVEALGRAANDARVDGIVAHINAPALGMARTQELRDAVLAFRKSGKQAVVYSTTLGGEGGGTIAYYLASSFQEIWLQPSGDVNLTGFMLESPFLKGTLDLVGVKPEFGARYEYKSAIEMYTRDRFSKEGKESLQLLVDNWTKQAVDGIAEGRNLKTEQVTAAIDQAPLLATEALQAKLVDHLAYWDELEKNLTKSDAKIIDLRRYADQLKPEPTAVKVALIYGVGPVQRGDDSQVFNDKAVMAADRVAKAFRDAVKDPEIKAILFRIDSPGGDYVASDTIWREVSNAHDSGKPVVVSMSNVAASGGYFAAIPADRIVAEPGTITGSIGVYGGKFVLSDLWKHLGLSWDEVHAGQNSGIWSANTPFTPAEWQRLNASLDHVYADFTGKAQQGRNLKPEDMDKLARGRIWTGERAKQNGLVDDIGGYEEAFVQIRQLAKLPSQMPVQLVTFPHPKTPLEMFVEMAQSGEVPGNIATDMAVLSKAAKIAAPLIDALPPQNGTLQMPPLTVK